jgi:predicted DNA-binding transcriptional regulator AlpA
MARSPTPQGDGMLALFTTSTQTRGFAALTPDALKHLVVAPPPRRFRNHRAVRGRPRHRDERQKPTDYQQEQQPPPFIPATDDDLERFLSRDEVCALVNLSYPTVWSMMCEGTFPVARRTSRNRVAWIRSEVLRWMRSRPPQSYKGMEGA